MCGPPGLCIAGAVCVGRPVRIERVLYVAVCACPLARQVQRPAAAARPAASAARQVTAAVSATGGSAAGQQVRLVTAAGSQPRNVTSGHPALLGIQSVRQLTATEKVIVTGN